MNHAEPLLAGVGIIYEPNHYQWHLCCEPLLDLQVGHWLKHAGPQNDTQLNATRWCWMAATAIGSDPQVLHPEMATVSQFFKLLCCSKLLGSPNFCERSAEKKCNCSH